MGPDIYAVAQADQLLSLLGPPKAEIQRELLGEFLINPFIDDDLQGLSLRTGLKRSELLEGLEALRAAGLLKDAGRRGFMLDLAGLDPEVEYADKMLSLPEVADADEGTVAGGWLEVVESLPFGVALLRPDGALVLANQALGRLLGWSEEGFDAAAFAERTRCDLAQIIAADAATSFSLADSSSMLEVQVHPCQYEGAQAVLVVVQDQSLQEEITQVYVQIQEELFAQLRGEVVEPLQMIRTYLENPGEGNLGTARAAFEQIDIFLQSFLLQVRSQDTSSI